MKEKYEFETDIVCKNGMIGTDYGSQYSDYPENVISIDEFIKSKIETNQKYTIKIIILKQE